MAFNCTIVFSPFHSTSLQRNAVAERLTGAADPCCRTSVSFALESGFQPGLVMLLIKKYPCSCFCWAFCSDRSGKACLEHPRNFYFGGLTAFSQQIGGKIQLYFQEKLSKFDGTMDKKNLLPWQTAVETCSTPPTERCDLLPTMPLLHLPQNL